MQYTIVNLNDILSKEENKDSYPAWLLSILNNFKCPINIELENFLKNNSFQSLKLKQSVTYLVLDENGFLHGYFTLALKSLTFNKCTVSNTFFKKISRVATLSEDGSKNTVPCYMIAQLSKNLISESRISGTEILSFAEEIILDLQNKCGGIAEFLESE